MSVYRRRGDSLAVSVTAASVQDRDGAHPAVAISKYPSIERVFADCGYAGQCAQTLSQRHDIRVQVVRHSCNKNVGRWVRAKQPDMFTVSADDKGFVVLAKRGWWNAHMPGTSVRAG